VSPAETADPTEVPFGGLTWVGTGNHVLDGAPIPQGERAILGGKVAAHCKVQGHSSMSFAKPAEVIEMPFEMKTGGPKETCIRWRSKSPREGHFYNNNNNNLACIAPVYQRLQRHF